jgi:benzoate/toluate 1,2-dioxygenase alpha subunit/2,4,5-trichlorophenoxyacetic acid oxygenase 1
MSEAAVEQRVRQLVDDRPDAGVFRVHKGVFSDPEVFELEQRFIFEKTWAFLGLESQIRRKHDFLTTHIGRTPVLVTRAEDGAVRAFANVCRHKGAMLCSREEGQARVHVCPYHGWAFDSSGKNVHLRNPETACYTEAGQAENRDLLPLPKLASYRGFIFGSLSQQVPPLEQFLGDACAFLDLIVDQSPDGVELIPGRTIYTYRGNWKLQLDNGVDPYHLSEAHASFLQVQMRRKRGEGHQEARSFDWAKRPGMPAGALNLTHGHSAVWLDQPEPEKRPIYPAIQEIRARVGDTKADWMLKGRNIGVFPNMQIADAISPMLRTFRPLAVDLTEMKAYCLAPVGEPREQRAWRLRQYEDFFNPGGMATPDDAVLYEDCQRGLQAHPVSYLQGTSRGMAAMREGSGEMTAQLGIHPTTSVEGRYDMYSEVAFHGPYREWQRLINAGLAGQEAYA